MKLRVKVDDRLYDVEVGNLTERPIKAIVDGTVFEIWPESKQVYTSPSSSLDFETSSNPLPQQTNDVEILGFRKEHLEQNKIKAPIPGIISKVCIQVGEIVQPGQELCILEAMKMNNSIRATKSGQIISIQVSVGQKVKHGDTLMEFGGN